MKRAAVIGSIIAAVAAIVFAFIIGGGDGTPTEAKAGTTTINPAKAGAEAISGNQQDQSGGPTTSLQQSDDNKGEGEGSQTKNCKAEQKNRYETKASFLGLSPTVVRSGKKVEFELKNFRPCVTVFITYVAQGTASPVTEVTSVQTDKSGKAEGKFVIATTGSFTVTASDGVVSKSTNLTVK